jgi:Mg2+ and Co2+ transporter CorA
MGESVGRQRAMTDEGHLLLVLHAPPSAGQDDREPRLFWRNAEGQWKSNSLGAGIQALKVHVEQFAEREDQLDGLLDTGSGARDYFAVLQAVAPLHRAARNLHSTLQQAREMMPAERDLINVRDRAGEIERALELVHVDAKNALDFTVARESEEQTQRSYDMAVASHRLNVLVAMFFPIATVSAVFGMNLPHGLEQYSTPIAFWGVLGASFVAGMLLTAASEQRPRPPGDSGQRKR